MFLKWVVLVFNGFFQSYFIFYLISFDLFFLIISFLFFYFQLFSLKKN